MLMGTSYLASTASERFEAAARLLDGGSTLSMDPPGGRRSLRDALTVRMDWPGRETP